MKFFFKELKNYKKEIDRYLNLYFKHKVIQSAKLSHFNKIIIDQLADYTLRGGKRLRSILFLYGYESTDCKISQRIIKLSIFLELLQSSLLIHDDIMDKSDLRRGKITMHKYFQKGFDKEFGNNIAIIAGDIAMQCAYEIITLSKIPDKAKIVLVKNISYYINLVNFGQAEDVYMGKINKYSERQVAFIHRNKTAAYTTLMPLLSGALIAKPNKNIINTLTKYAINTGLAFQIIDDVIGIFASEAEIGKSVTSDIAEGKKTLLITYAMKKLRHKDKQFLEQMLGNDKISKQEFNKIKYLLYHCGALHYSLEKANILIEKAIKIIKHSTMSVKTQEKLVNFALYILHKDKINLNFRTKI